MKNNWAKWLGSPARKRQIKWALVALVLLGGLVSGQSALESVESSEPQLQCSDLYVFVFGPIVGLTMGLGLQGWLGKPKSLRFNWSFFMLSAIYFFASGFSAALIS